MGYWSCYSNVDRFGCAVCLLLEQYRTEVSTIGLQLKSTSCSDQSRPHPSGCTLFFPFRGPNIGTHHTIWTRHIFLAAPSSFRRICHRREIPKRHFVLRRIHSLVFGMPQGPESAKQKNRIRVALIRRRFPKPGIPFPNSGTTELDKSIAGQLFYLTGTRRESDPPDRLYRIRSAPVQPSPRGALGDGYTDMRAAPAEAHA